MVSKLDKAISRLSKRERSTIKSVLFNIKKGDSQDLDIKKLKNREDIFRVRKGKIRIIYRKLKNNIKILAIERRSDTIYKDF